jgi:hypothetical protein
VSADDDLRVAYRLPLTGYPRAVVVKNRGGGGARLVVETETVADARNRDELLAGVTGTLASGEEVALRAVDKGGSEQIQIEVAGKRAVREDKAWAKPSRSAWAHAFIALGGSAAGFASSAVYLVKAHALADEWALKMGNHTAGWHLLLTFTLFPASVWGQRFGIRAVQVVSFVFFGIHLGIALANADLADRWIAFFNALSGVLFLVSVVYGQRAYRDMDPAAALASGRV